MGNIPAHRGPAASSQRQGCAASAEERELLMADGGGTGWLSWELTDTESGGSETDPETDGWRARHCRGNLVPRENRAGGECPAQGRH